MTDEVTVQKRNVSSEVRRGHSTEEEGAQPGHTRSGEVRVQRRERFSSNWITKHR